MESKNDFTDFNKLRWTTIGYHYDWTEKVRAKSIDQLLAQSWMVNRDVWVRFIAKKITTKFPKTSPISPSS